ncbi:ABC transporter ATP-binding protein [Desulfovibrio gilichinskyi]|uniref:ABC-2 type transport system ATP-binding protein n=1 Tax=Desulfovibrio gilichinskyi TaxID=1519643 RepID=A0A1X7C1P8_9BACT|nr:ABC transporter ATP-binding protein [Desulfovibrio gilichinskyi]SME88390.1 ABC-2 type transport system ATP-binding protein [Desulfovibrio gilichinskyi]
MDDQTVINVTGVTKIFGEKTVVNALDMNVKKGEIFGFLGPNGSGKTTFIRMLCGLLQPDAGSGTCLGYDILTESDLIKPKVGYMAQKFSLYGDLTVRENLDFLARAYQLPNRRKLIDEAIERMGLGRFAGQLADSLSGGWKQRLALTGCTLHSPQLLLLDEPTAGVDPSARRDFWDEVHNLAAHGITALISTHYMDEAERCHRLAYIAYGNLLVKGTLEELIANSGLHTWTLKGPRLAEMTPLLRATDGIDQVVAFGNTLHISGRDKAKIENGIKTVAGPDNSFSSSETSLEEVFIDLMKGKMP